MEKLIAGLAVKEIAKTSSSFAQSKTNSPKFMRYGCWSTGTAVLFFLGHSYYLKEKYSMNGLYHRYRNKDYLWEPLKLYCPIILNQLLVSFSQNDHEVFLFTFSSIIYISQYIMEIPYISLLSAAFTLLGCVLKYKN